LGVDDFRAGESTEFVAKKQKKTKSSFIFSLNSNIFSFVYRIKSNEQTYEHSQIEN